MEVNSQTEGLPNDRIHVGECLVIVVRHHNAGGLLHCANLLTDAILDAWMLGEKVEDARKRRRGGIGCREYQSAERSLKT